MKLSLKATVQKKASSGLEVELNATFAPYVFREKSFDELKGKALAIFVVDSGQNEGTLDIELGGNKIKHVTLSCTTCDTQSWDSNVAPSVAAIKGFAARLDRNVGLFSRLKEVIP
jgi:hypothetical protein